MKVIHKNFTIVELLVVFSVLAVLVSLMQPSLATIAKQTEKLNCLNNYRQINGLVNLYKDDHNGGFYQLWHHNPWNKGWHAWGFILSDSGYLDLSVDEDMIYCPSMDKSLRRPWTPKFATYGVIRFHCTKVKI